MDENKNSRISDIMVITIAIVIGGVIVHYLLKPKIAVTSLQESNVSSLETNNRLDSIEQRLQQLQIQPPLNNQSIITQQSTYKNSEETNFILNKDGDIIGMKTTRDANIT